MIDLIVAGGGPVGLATAITAARAGLEVAIVEPRAGAIDKACGEGLMPDALARLRSLGVEPSGIDFDGIRYRRGRHVAEARFMAGPGRGVRRTALHGAMLTRAQQLGVQLVRGRVTELTQTAGWVDVAGLRARHMIGADGLHSSVARAIGVRTVPRASRARRYGVRQHYAAVPWTNLVEVHWLPAHEVYVTPVSAHSVGVAVLGRRPLNLRTAIAAIPALADALEGAATLGPARGAGPLRQSTTARVVGRVLLVGDAAGYVDALTGEGLRIGFAEAEAAVRAILTDQPDGYETEWKRITRTYRTLTSALLWVGDRRMLRPMVVPAARAMPGTFGRMIDRIAG